MDEVLVLVVSGDARAVGRSRSSGPTALVLRLEVWDLGRDGIGFRSGGMELWVWDWLQVWIRVWLWERWLDWLKKRV